MATSKHWLLAPKAPPDLLRRFRGVTPVLAQVLYNRGFTEPERAQTFLTAKDPSVGGLLSIRGKKPSIDQALARIRQAIKAKERIVVYGDFDADGVTSTALLVQVLEALGAVVFPYIPHRIDEGYGLNSEALLKLARKGVRLVITVDCGIRSVDEVEDGKAAGLDIIVTDHHSLGPEIPKARAVINPKCTDAAYSEDMLAGVGVAYRLAEALLTTFAAQNRASAHPLELSDLLDLVAIGTVADLAPLNRAENRALVRRGLEVLNEARRPGIRALLDVAGLKPGNITAINIGFALGPRINAAGRLDSAMTAYQLLSTHDEREARELASKLQALNQQRQELTRSAQTIIRSQIAENGATDLPLIFASGEFQPGIVGLVAGRLTEEFYRPAVVMEVGEHESRASCRSIPQFDITRALDECAALLVRHGGHAQAAGFTVANENIDALKERLLDIAADALSGQELKPTIEIDAELEPEAVSLDLCEDLSRLEPTGHANDAPVFMTRGLKVLEARGVGRDEAHLKLRVQRPGGSTLDAIGFNLGEWRSRINGGLIDLAYQVEVNEWNGNRNPQLNVQDIRHSS